MLKAKAPLIAPSILAADLTRLGEELGKVGNADLIHFDVMDGHFVPNLSFGPGLLSAVKRACDLPVDVHLMVDNPDDTFGAYLDAGADVVCFHLEAATHPMRIIDEVHARGALAAAAINPGTAVSALDALVDHLDMVLVMSVNPGFGGQRFIEATYRQLATLERLFEEHGVRPLVEVDGGIGSANAEAVCAAGADVLVAGSAVFGTTDPASAVDKIRALARSGQGRRMG